MVSTVAIQEPSRSVEPSDTPILTDQPTSTPNSTDTPEATDTPHYCTPPPCKEDEIFYCADECPYGCGTICVTVTPSIPIDQQAQVIRIIDGDTIEVEIDGQAFSVRYIGIDTPEQGQPFSEQTTRANAELVSGQTVVLVKDVSETDRYGRLLRYVYLLDGTFVNAELVRTGFAQVVSYPPDVAQINYFTELQNEARENELGLWAIPTDTPTPVPSNTPIPVPTDTPIPLPTNSPIPLPTNTLIPIPTDTPVPVQPTQPPSPPNVQITYIFFDGVVPRVESDEYAQITNQGGSPVNLSGWRLNADDPGQDFWFPSFDLQPGQSCRVYTNEYHPETCGFSFGSGQALWNNSDRECGRLYDPSGAEVSSYCY